MPETSVVRGPGCIPSRPTNDVTVESIASVHEKRESVLGLRMVHEPTYLRHFQARFERL
jgi:tryptophanase